MSAWARTIRQAASAVVPRMADVVERRWRLVMIGIPLAWLVVFFLIPFLVVLKISLSESTLGQPPYGPMLQSDGPGRISLGITGASYGLVVSEPLYATAYFGSLSIALVSTLAALLIGYPVALYIARSPPGLQRLMLLLVILPFWTSFLLRVYAWMGLLKDTGAINAALLALGVVAAPIQLVQTSFAVHLGIVYAYLPFMILPLYANLVHLDRELGEAAADLGATPFMTFVTITLPLSWRGIAAGSALVAIPATGEVLIPSLLGGPDTLMIGRVLWDEFFLNRDWPMAAAVAVAILVVVACPLLIATWPRASRDRDGSGSTGALGP